LAKAEKARESQAGTKGTQQLRNLGMPKQRKPPMRKAERPKPDSNSQTSKKAKAV
jgi:hypothetical protein